MTTHYAFRNGPVENMHADGKLSDNAMMKLNKFIVNRLAYIFTLMLDDDKMKVIKDHYLDENIELRLANAAIKYAFNDGIIEKKIEIEKLNEDDIEVLFDYMQLKLMIVFNLIMDRNINMIKKYLLMGFLYGHSWDYAVPDSIDFESFLDILKEA